MQNGTSFMHYIYCMNKSDIVFLMAVLFFGCAVLEGILFVNAAKAKDTYQNARKIGKEKRRGLQTASEKAKKAVFIYLTVIALTFLANLAAVLGSTVFSRSTGSYGVYMELFRSVKADPHYEENYRTLLMNIFFFFPMGFAAVLLPRRWNVWLRVGLMTVFGFVLSCGCEHLQFALQVGIAEADDVLMNTTGMLLGALHLVLGEYWAKHETWQRLWVWLRK